MAFASLQSEGPQRVVGPLKGAYEGEPVGATVVGAAVVDAAVVGAAVSSVGSVQCVFTVQHDSPSVQAVEPK